ncbi:hypothetical protein [Kallotenue papyrolyticum]|uniref:hypothetical protein n=1 Tax=Kallotenue papyrolyticum TaxID=1325125 RepID=UPI000470B653|nr:hypothetical protein [Kallotenue papyrolyticum]
MLHESAPLVILPPDALPEVLREWLERFEQPALLVAIERLPDGRVALQTLPEVDPALVARLRKLMGQYADVLRRLS